MIKALYIKKIIEADGGVIISANNFNTLELIAIAQTASHSKTIVTIKNVDKKAMIDLTRIAQAGQGRVIFDFT